MTFFMFVSLLCFCIIMLLCSENISALKVKSKKREIIFAVLMAAAVLALAFVIAARGIEISMELYLFLAGLLIALVQTIQYKSAVKGIAIGAISMFYAFGMQGVVVLFFQLLGYEEPPSYEQIVFFAFIGGVAALIWILTRILKKRIDINIFNNRGMYLVTALSGIMIVITYINYRSAYLDAAGDIIYALFFASVIVMFILIVYYVFKENAARTERLVAAASKKYIEDLEASYTALRKIKHDYVNILTSFKLYMDQRDMDGLASYYYTELSELNQDLLQQDKLMGSLHNVQIPEIKSILIYKCSLAAERQITVTIEANDPITRLGVSTAIVCQILGILLDNAIEAAEEAEEKTLHIALIRNPDSTIIIIKNTWIAQETDINKLFKLGFSTKAPHRGMGLHTVRNYTCKIKGLLLETEADKDAFTQILSIKDGK